MTTQYADRVLQTTTVTGTGAATPSSSVTGYSGWAARFTAGTTEIPYLIEAIDDATMLPSGAWESGLGTWNGTALERTLVSRSSTGTAAINFAAGTKLMTATVNEAALATKAEKGDIASSGLSMAGLGLAGVIAAGLLARVFIGDGLQMLPDGLGRPTLSATGTGTSDPDFARAVMVTGADATAAASSNAAFTAAARKACGIDPVTAAGTPTSGRVMLIPAGEYLLDNWAPTDANGDTLDVQWWAFPGTVKVLNRLSTSTASSAGVVLDYATWQRRNKVQRQCTAVTLEMSRPTFGFSTAPLNDNPVTALEIGNTTGWAVGDIGHIVARDIMPYTYSDGSKVRVGEAFRVMDLDATKLYIPKLAFHDFYETDIWVTRFDSRRTFKASNIIFGGAATTIGRTTAKPRDLENGLWGRTDNAVSSVTKSGSTVTVNCLLPHLLAAGQYIHGKNADQPQFNITTPVTAILDANRYTYTLRSTSDDNQVFGACRVGPASNGQTLTGSGDTINVVGTVSTNLTPTALFAPSGSFTIDGQTITYTGKTVSSFTGCSGGAGLVLTSTATGQRDVTQSFAQVPDTVTGPFVYNDAFASLEFTNHSGNVTLRCGPKAEFHDCASVDSWTGGLRLVSSPASQLYNFCSEGLPNAGTQAPQFAGGRLGYPVTKYGPSGLTTWQGGRVLNARHPDGNDGFGNGTYNPQTDGAATEWFKLGSATYCVTSNVDSYDCWGIPFDTHEDGSDNAYINCKVFSPMRGPQGGSYSAAGFQCRGRKTRVINCYQKGGNFGVRITASEQLGEAARVSSSAGLLPLRYTVTSITRSGTTATFVTSIAAHISPGDMVRLRGADQANYNIMVRALTYNETTRTGTFTLPTTDDFGLTFGTPPASAVTPATGTITLQPIFRSEHIVNNFVCDDLLKGKGGVIFVDDMSAVRFRSKVQVNGITAQNVPVVINSEDAGIVIAKNVSVSKLRVDTSSDGSGAVATTTGTGKVVLIDPTLDATDSMSNATGLYMGRFTGATGTPEILVINPTIIQHPTYNAVPRIFDNRDGGAGKRAGLWGLNYVNSGNLSADFQIMSPAQVAQFTWIGGGQELFLPTQTDAITNTTVTVGQRGTGSTFIVRRASALLTGNAVGNVTIDLLRNGVSVLGATKMVAAAGAALTAEPVYSVMSIPADSSLSVTAVSSSGSETARLNGVTLSGYWT